MDKEEFLEIVEKVITQGNARAMAQLFGTIAKNFVKDTLTGSILLTLHEDHIELMAFNVDEDEALDALGCAWARMKAQAEMRPTREEMN
jgi:hypothetical protein